MWFSGTSAGLRLQPWSALSREPICGNRRYTIEVVLGRGVTRKGARDRLEIAGGQTLGMELRQKSLTGSINRWHRVGALGAEGLFICGARTSGVLQPTEIPGRQQILERL